MKKAKMKEFIKGGLADGVPCRLFNKGQLAKGVQVELEHTNNPRVAKEIAKDHLIEFPNYYKALEKMENQLRKKK